MASESTRAYPLQAVADAATPPATAIEPLLVDAATAGRMCGRAESSWWRDHAAGRVPRPLKLGGRTLWRVAELREWVAAGCPHRKVWEQR